MAILTDHQFEALVNQIQTIDKQINIMQESKVTTFKTFGITKQGYYSRKKRHSS